MLITVYEFCEYCLMPIRQPCDKECCYNFYILFASECASRSYAQVLVVSGATIFRLSFLGRMGRWMIWNARLLPKPFFYSMRIEILYATCIMWFLHNQPLKPVNPKNPNNNIFPHIPQTPPLVDISVITPQIRSPHVNNPPSGYLSLQPSSSSSHPTSKNPVSLALVTRKFQCFKFSNLDNESTSIIWNTICVKTKFRWKSITHFLDLELL